MSRLMPYLGIVAAIAVGFFVTTIAGGKFEVHSPFQVATLGFPTVNIPAQTVIASTSTQPEPESTPTQDTSPAEPVSVSVSPPAPPTNSPSVSALLDISASSLRGALVNIICYAPAGSALHSISGSGVIVDPDGFIITNAHIAQFFLLAERGVSCVIRSGGPAKNRYKASLAYISPVWIRTNAKLLTQITPSGTGEYDFAILAIYAPADSGPALEPLPAQFPYVPLATSPVLADTPVVIASYGAQFLQSNQITSNLFPTIVFGSVKDVYTFGTKTVDVLALGGSAAAQEGSSGGGIAESSGSLVGVIMTSTTEGSTDTRSLNAITASYIRGEYASETGEPIDLLLSKSPSSAISDFAPQVPALEKLLTAQLP